MEKMNPSNWLLWKPLAYMQLFARELSQKRTFFLVWLHFQKITWYKSFRFSIIKSLIKKIECAMDTIFFNWSFLFVYVFFVGCKHFKILYEPRMSHSPKLVNVNCGSSLLKYVYTSVQCDILYLFYLQICDQKIAKPLQSI